MIVGIGVDIVDTGRFQAALRRTPALAARLFAESERDARPESLAASFAAKEAVAKALGAPLGLLWTDVTVGRDAAAGLSSRRAAPSPPQPPAVACGSGICRLVMMAG